MSNLRTLGSTLTFQYHISIHASNCAFMCHRTGPHETCFRDLSDSCLAHIAEHLPPADIQSFLGCCTATRALQHDWPMWAAWLVRHRGQHALHVAAKADKAGVIPLVASIPNAPDVNACMGMAMQTAMHVACHHGHAASVRALLGVSGVDIRCQAGAGATPLHTACIKGHAHIVQLLLQLAADRLNINAVDEDGSTPLHYAARLNHPAVVQLLLSAPGIEVNALDEDGCTPLHDAVAPGHVEVVELLLSAPSIDINIAEPEDGETPLILAAKDGRVHMTQLLLAVPSNDVNAADVKGHTALHRAVQVGAMAVVKLLLAAPGINVNATARNGETPLHFAIKQAQTAMVQLLLKAPGIDVNARSLYGVFGGVTPLELAEFVGRERCKVIIKMLVAAGAE